MIGPCQSACPKKCKTCKASEGRSAEGQDGGKSLGKNGHCEYYCSKWGFCGTGAQYSKDGVDCKGCKSGANIATDKNGINILGYREQSSRCVDSSAIDGYIFDNLQRAWDICELESHCEGVIEPQCGTNSWALCFTGGSRQESGYPGCLYRKY